MSTVASSAASTDGQAGTEHPALSRRRELGATSARSLLLTVLGEFVLPAARYMNWLTSRPGLKEFLKGITSGVVGLIFSISIPLAKVAFMPGGSIDWIRRGRKGKPQSKRCGYRSGTCHRRKSSAKPTGS